MIMSVFIASWKVTEYSCYSIVVFIKAFLLAQSGEQKHQSGSYLLLSVPLELKTFFLKVTSLFSIFGEGSLKSFYNPQKKRCCETILKKRLERFDGNWKSGCRILIWGFLLLPLFSLLGPWHAADTLVDHVSTSRFDQLFCLPRKQSRRKKVPEGKNFNSPKILSRLFSLYV